MQVLARRRDWTDAVHVRVGGLTTAYERAGSGPPVLLVHGFVGDGRLTWGDQITVLADDFTAVAGDRARAATADSLAAAVEIAASRDRYRDDPCGRRGHARAAVQSLSSSCSRGSSHVSSVEAPDGVTFELRHFLRSIG